MPRVLPSRCSSLCPAVDLNVPPRSVNPQFFLISSTPRVEAEFGHHLAVHRSIEAWDVTGTLQFHRDLEGMTRNELLAPHASGRDVSARSSWAPIRSVTLLWRSSLRPGVGGTNLLPASNVHGVSNEGPLRRAASNRLHTDILGASGWKGPIQ